MTSIATIENIVKQTEKAILVDVGNRNVWVPRSVTTIDDTGVVFAKIWFAKQNALGCFNYHSVRV